MEFLPTIKPQVETARLLWGSMMRLCLCSCSYTLLRWAFSKRVRSKEDFYDTWKRETLPCAASVGMEIGASVVICPVRYLAAVTTPRFILDYVFTSWSDVLAALDGFLPGHFASYAMYAFASDAEWNFDFFVWQLPSVALTLAKLFYRRRKLGSERCRTKRVLAMIPLQMLLRAYLAGFSVMVPENSADAITSAVLALLECILVPHFARLTWPFET